MSGAATDSAPARTRLRGWTGSRCAGCRTGACASRERGSERACGSRSARQCGLIVRLLRILRVRTSEDHTHLRWLEAVNSGDTPFDDQYVAKWQASRLLKNNSLSTADCGTRRHARRRSAAESHVQLFVAGSAGAERSSLRAIRVMVDEVLAQLSRRFDAMYARVGRPSIAPEKLLRAQREHRRKAQLLIVYFESPFCSVAT